MSEYDCDVDDDDDGRIIFWVYRRGKTLFVLSLLVSSRFLADVGVLLRVS